MLTRAKTQNCLNSGSENHLSSRGIKVVKRGIVAQKCCCLEDYAKCAAHHLELEVGETLECQYAAVQPTSCPLRRIHHHRLRGIPRRP